MGNGVSWWLYTEAAYCAPDVLESTIGGGAGGALLEGFLCELPDGFGFPPEGCEGCCGWPRNSAMACLTAACEAVTYGSVGPPSCAGKWSCLTWAPRAAMKSR